MDPVSLLVGGAVGIGAASLAAPLLGRTREHRGHADPPAGLADLLGWAFLVDDGVVLLKDGGLLAGFRYRGPDVGSATTAELDALGAQVNDALLPYGDGWMFHVDAIRTPAAPYPAGRFPDPVTAWIDAERRRAFGGTPGGSLGKAGMSARQYVSDYTLCVTFVPSRETYARAASVFVQGAPKGVDWARVLGEFRAAVDTLGSRLAARLHVERLGSDALVTHLHRCLTGLRHAVSAPPHGAYLNTLLASQELVGGFSPKLGALHLRVVALQGYPPAVGVGALDVLNGLAFPYRWSSRFLPVGQYAAERLLKRHQQQWFMGRRGLGTLLREIAGGGAESDHRRRQSEELFYDRDAGDMARDAALALAENASGAVRFGYATQVVVIADADAATAGANAATVLGALRDRGFPARVETVNALDAFFGTLPGHGAPNLRRPLLTSRNVAALWPVTGVWAGLDHNPSPFFPPDAPPLLHVATDGSTPFRLNLHVGDVGHTLVVGATGAGKSTLVGLVVAQWQRYAPDLGAQTVVFDVGGSHWLLARATGAAHYDLTLGSGGTGGGEPASGRAGRAPLAEPPIVLQPLADVDRPSERAWAVGWLETLLELQGIAITPEHRQRLDRAVTLLAAQPRGFRTLTELTVQLQDPTLAAALAPYTVTGPYGRLLDADCDTLDADQSTEAPRHQVFELRALMDLDDRVLVPVLLYLFRRVERRLDGRPTLIVIEELWAPLLRTVFANRIRQWLLTLRKQNAAVVLVAHSPAQLDAVPAKQVLIESCPTRVLLPNPDAAGAAAAGYRALGCNDRELARLATAVPKRDYYVKSPLGSRLVRLDLGPVALAFVGTPAGMTPDEVRPTVEALAARHGRRWPAAWLEALGVQAPDLDGPSDEASAAVTLAPSPGTSPRVRPLRPAALPEWVPIASVIEEEETHANAV